MFYLFVHQGRVDCILLFYEHHFSVCVCVCGKDTFRVEFSFDFSLRMRNPLTCVSTGTISRRAPDRDAVSVHVEQHVWVEIWHPCLSLSFLLSLKLLVSFVPCESSDCGQ